MKKFLIALFVLPCAVFAQTTTIAVVPKGSTSNFWKIYEAGARKAAADLQVEVIVRSPRFESDIEAQIKMVDYFREKKVAAIVLSPQHKDKLVPVVEKAIDAGIPVLVTDSALNSTKISTFLASDNFQTGEVGGKALAKFLGADTVGEVALLRYVKGSASSEEREKGAMQELKAGLPKATIVDSYYSSAVLGDAKRVCDTLMQEHPNLKGILAITTTSTTGLVRSLEQSGLAGKVIVVGSTSNNEGLAAVRNRHANAVIVQNPYEMGYRAVKDALAVVKGGKLPARQIMDTVLVTAENVDTPDVQHLINP